MLPPSGRTYALQLSSTGTDHHNESAELQEGPDSNGTRENQHPRIGQRFCLAILCILSGVFLALNAPNDDRILLRTSFVGGGMLLDGIGYSLWWFTGLSWTWGLWLRLPHCPTCEKCCQ
jgi:hypothetical protein